MIADAGQVFYAAAAHKYYRVLLKVVTDTRYIAVTSIPVVNLTRATLRKAELGFFGVEV